MFASVGRSASRKEQKDVNINVAPAFERRLRPLWSNPSVIHGEALGYAARQGRASSWPCWPDPPLLSSAERVHFFTWVVLGRAPGPVALNRNIPGSYNRVGGV